MGYHAHEEVASQQAYSISRSGECFRDLLSLAELHVVTGGGGLAPLAPHPCQCHSEAFCGGVAFGQMREGSDLLSGHVVARSPAWGCSGGHSPQWGWEQDLLLT